MIIDNKKLYRSDNKTTLQSNGIMRKSKHFRHTRNTKVMIGSTITKGKMRSKNNLGYDITPTVMYLYSKLNNDFDLIYSEINQILNNGLHSTKIKQEILSFINNIIYKNVIIESNIVFDVNKIELSSFFRCGESSYYDSFFIDTDNKLRLIKEVTKEVFETNPCTCHTYSYNGKKYTNKNKNENF